MVYERVGPWLFEFSAGSFFQNNNSILIPLVEYVREAIFPSGGKTVPTHLVDAYCGSGLFGITLSPYFTRIAGVEISEPSIKAARRNAEMNGLKEDKAEWIVGKAEEIFGGLEARGFKGDESCVVVDVSPFEATFIFVTGQGYLLISLAPKKRLRRSLPETTPRLQASNDSLRQL